MTSTPLVITRFTYVGLFLWFGVSQISDPTAWVSFLPAWLGYIPIPGEMLIQLNGWLEICLALALFLGVWTRVIAGFLAFHLFGIAFSVGGAIGARDTALGMIGVVLAIQPPDRYTLDHYTRNALLEEKLV